MCSWFSTASTPTRSPSSGPRRWASGGVGSTRRTSGSWTVAGSCPHLDIQVKNLQPELARLTDLGARVITPTHDDAGFVTTILADPEGNEFCVIVPPADGYDWGQLTGGEG